VDGEVDHPGVGVGVANWMIPVVCSTTGIRHSVQNRDLRRAALSGEQSSRAAISMFWDPSAAYKIMRARCTVRNDKVTVVARRYPFQWSAGLADASTD
jgi:hypothetical protein